MGKKFDLPTAQKFSETLVKTADTMETETTKVQENFAVLGETFKDKGYSEFQSELYAADKTIENIVSDIRNLNRLMLDYTNKMGDLL